MRKVVAALVLAVSALVTAPAHADVPKFPTMEGHKTSDNFGIYCTGRDSTRWCRIRTDKPLHVMYYDVYTPQYVEPGVSWSFAVSNFKPRPRVYDSIVSKVIDDVRFECYLFNSNMECRIFISRKVEQLTVNNFVQSKFQYGFNYWPNK